MYVDVTDASFDADVINRSDEVTVVVDLWAPWCGPCRQLGPILETVIAETEGKVILVKVNVDESPQVSATFRVQSIPAVFALKDRKVVNGFVGAQGEAFVRDFVAGLLPVEELSAVAQLLALGDEASLREALALEPANADVITALATLLVEDGQPEEALALVSKIPETAETRRIAAVARMGGTAAAESDDIEGRLLGLLDRVKGDEAARQEFLDLLAVLGPEDPRTAGHRRALTSRLF